MRLGDKIEVTRNSADGLARHVWIFDPWFHDALGVGPMTIRLNYWASETRATTRHKFRAQGKLYSQSDNHWGLKVLDVPLPADVVAEARVVFRERLRKAVDAAEVTGFVRDERGIPREQSLPVRDN